MRVEKKSARRHEWVIRAAISYHPKQWQITFPAHKRRAVPRRRVAVVIKQELKKLGLGAHGKKAELVARLEEHLSTEPSQAEPSNADPNNGWLLFVLADEDTRTWRIN